MKILPAVFLQALACLTVHAGEEPPAWAMKVLSERLSTRYELVQKLEPSFYVGDFNGDGKSDVALLIKEKTTAKVGIAIIDGGESKIKIVGAGKSFGNGGDDFSWMDAWSASALRQSRPAVCRQERGCQCCDLLGWIEI